MNRIYLLIPFAAATFALSLDVGGATAPTVTTTVTPTITPTTTPTTTTTLPPDVFVLCPRWEAVARETGFDESLLARLDHVIHRESRCDPTQLNADDPNGGSVGLTQINRFWCLPSRYYPNGYLQHVGVLDACDELYDPRTNLAAALALVNYSRSIKLCAWEQWAWIETPCESDE